MRSAARHSTVDEYIASFPPKVRAVLTRVRRVVLKAVPDAEERISYGMPAVFRDGVVVYYAAFKNHIGLYPPARDPAIRARVARYAGPRGNLQFPLSEPLPLELIDALVRSRLEDNMTRAARRDDLARRAAVRRPR